MSDKGNTPVVAERVRLAFAEAAKKMRQMFNRHVPAGDLVQSRWDRARSMKWGEGSSCYDGSLVIGDVKVGARTWVGPWTVLDGSGGLAIGEGCSISAGVHVYTHTAVAHAASGGVEPITHAPTRIGDRCFIGPNSVIAAGVTIGDGAVVGACSFVNADVAPGARVAGSPARAIGMTMPRP